MSYDIHFENDGRGVVLDFRGAVSGEEILEATRAMYRADSQHRLRYQIVDLAGVDSLDMSDDQVRGIALLDHQAATKNPGQIVALVGDDALLVGAERRYAIYADVWAGFRSQHFRTIEAARAWIAALYPDAAAGGG